MKRRNEQKGVALVTTILFSTLVIVLTGVIFLRISHASKEITKRDMIDRSNTLTDATLSNLVNWMNNKSWDLTNSDNLQKNQNIDRSALAFIEDLYTRDEQVMNSSSAGISGDLPNTSITPYSPFVVSSLLNSAFQADSKNAGEALIDWTQSAYLTNFMTGTNTINVILSDANYKGIDTLISQELGLLNEEDPNRSAAENLYLMTPNRLAEKIFRPFEITTKDFRNKIHKQTVQISVLPLTTNINNGLTELELHGCVEKGTSISALGDISTNCSRDLVVGHVDVYKVIAKTCVPDCNANSVYTKYYELLVQRPVVTASDFNMDHAVLSDGTIDLKNATTNSGVTYLDSTNEGDIHSNNNVAIGPNGMVNGKVTSSGWAYFGTPTDDTSQFNGSEANVIPTFGIQPDGVLNSTNQISNKIDSKSKADRIDVPDLDLGEMPTTECNLALSVLQDCRITGNYNQTKNQSFAGKVYITGNYTQKGDFYAVGYDPVKIIVDGTITIGGNAQAKISSDQEAVFVSNSSANPAIKIAGNPGTGKDSGAVFYTSQPSANIQVRGNAEVFGSIVAKGTVEFDGSMTVKRDLKMDAFKGMVVPQQTATQIQIVSWKELKNL